MLNTHIADKDKKSATKGMTQDEMIGQVRYIYFIELAHSLKIYFSFLFCSLLDTKQLRIQCHPYSISLQRIHNTLKKYEKKRTKFK